MNILLWHVHGSWTTAFVQGDHRYIVPVTEGRDADGLGRAKTWTWPESVVERSPEALKDEPLDAIILQRPRDAELVWRWLGIRAGWDVPAIYVEHNLPQGAINDMVHPLASDGQIPVVHVTHFNRLFWNCGKARTYVIEHGIVDPGYRYHGNLARAAVVINEPGRRARVTGTDLLPSLGAGFPVDLYGIGAADFGGIENLSQEDLHAELAVHRAYVHPFRWTSLGLSLIEAMHLGLPVLALATTSAPDAVPADAGFVTSNVDDLVAAGRYLLDQPALAREMGLRGREYASTRFRLERFLRDWDAVLEDCV